MKFSRATLISPQELAETLGLSTATLADWRSQSRGPTYLAVGRKIWYPIDRVEMWLQTNLKETGDDGTAQETACACNYCGHDSPLTPEKPLTPMAFSGQTS